MTNKWPVTHKKTSTLSCNKRNASYTEISFLTHQMGTDKKKFANILYQ